MAEKKIVIRQYSGSAWDELLPRTSADQVDETPNRLFTTTVQQKKWDDYKPLIDGKAPISHGHTIAEVTNLQTTLDGKAPTVHTHTIANVTNLQTTLDGKAPTVHSHTLANISDAGTSASKNVGTAVGNVPLIGANGKLDGGIMPAIAITDTFVVNSQTAMLALNVEVGDIAVRSDQNKTYILRVEPATVLANWQELLTPTSPVTSVNGKTGVVTISATDLALGNVTNESKATMFTSPALTGTPTAPTPVENDISTKIATTSFVDRLVTKKVSMMPQSSTTVSATAPVSPTQGDFWYELL